jgi:hypothetical protein
LLAATQKWAGRKKPFSEKAVFSGSTALADVRPARRTQETLKTHGLFRPENRQGATRRLREKPTFENGCVKLRPVQCRPSFQL